MGSGSAAICNFTLQSNSGCAYTTLVFNLELDALSLKCLFFLVASKSLDTLAGLVNDPNPFTVKAVIQILTSVYPMLFRMLYELFTSCRVGRHLPSHLTLRCTNRNLRATWDTLVQCKTRILEFVWSSSVSIGVKLSAVKFLQRVILIQTRGVSDPRVVFCSLSPVIHLTFDLQYILACCKFAAPKQKRPEYLVLPRRPPVYLSNRIGSRRETPVGRYSRVPLYEPVSIR